MNIYSYVSTHGISGLAAGGDCEQCEVSLKMTIERTQRYTPRPWPSEFGDAIEDRDRVKSDMLWETVIERVGRCTLRPPSGEFGDAIGYRNGGNSELPWEAVIEGVWTCTWRPGSSELRNALEGCGRATLDMPLAAKIEWTQRYTGRPWSCEFGHALGGRKSWTQRWTPSCDWANLDMHLQQAMIEGDWRSSWRWLI